MPAPSKQPSDPRAKQSELLLFTCLVKPQPGLYLRGLKVADAATPQGFCDLMFEGKPEANGARIKLKLSV